MEDNHTLPMITPGTWRRASLTLVLLAVSAGMAQAGTLTFSYTSTVGTFAGTVSGTLQPDLNTFLVTGLGPVTFNGGPVAMSFVDSVDHFWAGQSGAVPTLTLNGSYLDLIECTGGCSVGFVLAAGNVYSGFFGHDVFLSSFLGGWGLSEPLNVANWSASADVPEPGTFAFLLLPLGLAVQRLRRRP